MPRSKLPGINGEGSQITVTNTATSLLELIRTAGSDPGFEFRGENYLVYALSDGSATDIRYFVDESVPTTTAGELIELGDAKTLYGINLSDVQLIVTSGTASVLDIGIGTFSHGQPSDTYGTGAITIEGGSITIGATAPQALGTDATGQDAYATILTSVAAATHISASLEGTDNAIISVDAGTTDHILVPANSIVTLDGLAIAATTAVQAKNAAASMDYTNLNITIW